MKISISAKTAIDRSSQLYQSLLKATPELSRKNFTLWGKAAEAESANRLNWVDLPTQSLNLIPELKKLENFIKTHQLDNFILAGMGGSSLGPEVLAKTYKKNLVVLDATDPAQILAATPKDLHHTAVIVGSKSGSTAETSAQKAYFTRKFEEAGLRPQDHFIIITDPGSPFDIASRSEGYFVINADPLVGGRFSVLSAFGIVPASAIGIDIAQLLADAREAAQSFTFADSAAVEIATRILESKEQNIAFFDSDSSVPGLSDWIEQLIAESTGKDGKGFLPIAIEAKAASISGSAYKVSFSPDTSADLVVEAPLGAQFILWEWVTALISIPQQINPFDQPNVTEAKTRALALLETWNNKIPTFSPTIETENLQIFTKEGTLSSQEAVENFFSEKSHYIAIMAYLARGLDDEILKLRPLIATASGAGTSFGWGPRFLHSTGQFHKGGVPNGAFVQITGDCDLDCEIPGKPYSFHTLLMAQALGDGEALAERKFPLIRFHLKNRKAGIAELLALFNNVKSH